MLHILHILHIYIYIKKTRILIGFYFSIFKIVIS